MGLKTAKTAKTAVRGKAMKFVRGKRKAKAAMEMDPTCILRATEKAMNCKLVYENRAVACHGRSIREVLNMNVDGVKYRKADLKYDLKGGRLDLLPPRSDAGPVPQGRGRPKAPRAGEPLPEATLNEFFQFLACQLSIESREHLGEELAMTEKGAAELFPEVDKHVKPNLGNTERWVPYHTVLGVHELFLMEAVHSRKDWNDKQKFLAMFIFRAHCKRDLFLQAQVPLMKDQFWKNPLKAFEANGPMEKAIALYRKKTGNALLTNCFRIIPERVLKDNDANLVRSIVTRTSRLLPVAEKAYDVIKDSQATAFTKLHRIASMVQNTEGCGDTWAKMLTVPIDMAYPKLKLLESDCEVGIGAAPPLQILLASKTPDRRQALRTLLKKVNQSKTASAKHFWKVLEKVEKGMCKKYRHLPLVVKQATTKPHTMSASTLQVQLCEYRQFRHTLARNLYGLADDQSMRTEETSKTVSAEDYMTQEKNCMKCIFPCEDRQVTLDVSLKPAKSPKVAARVLSMMFQKVISGESEAEAVSFRDKVLMGYTHGEDVADDSDAWSQCKVQLSHPSPLVAFQFEAKDGTKFPFQTTVAAAGSILQAERLARLCWERLRSGKSKDDTIKWRDAQYKLMKQEDTAGQRAAKGTKRKRSDPDA